MASERPLAYVLVIAIASATAHAQTAPIEPAPAETVPTEVAPAEPAAPVSAPAVPDAPVAAAADVGKPETKRSEVRSIQLVIGLEAGIGTPGGTSATVYGAGRGTGLVVGLQVKRFSIEWHLLQSYALNPKDDQLRGETTLGELTTSSLLARVRLLDVPLIEVMAGPAMLSAPIYVIGEDAVLQQRVEASSMSGLGVIAGAAVGYRITRRLEVSLELRAVIASRWELPGRVWVVPGETAPDGGRMFTTSMEDASGSPRTATILVRALL